MPKVSEEYYEKKRQEIIDAAYRVCTNKPITAVTMKDIIAETGFSHGVVYRYYKELDEIITDLLIRLNIENKMEERVMKVFEGAQTSDWENVIRRVFETLAMDLEDTDDGILKIALYCDVLTITEVERSKRIAERIQKENPSPLAGPIAAMTEFLMRAIEAEGLHPVISIEDAIRFIVVYYQGVQNAYLFTKDSDTPEERKNYSPTVLFSYMADSLIQLMKGGKDG